MSKQNKSPDCNEENQETYTPASPVKRTLAWIALAYVVIFLILTTYYYYTGTMLGNLGPALTIPGLIGMGILSLVSWRTTGKPGKWPAICLTILCWILAVVTIPVALAGFLSNFGVMGVLITTTAFGG